MTKRLFELLRMVRLPIEGVYLLLSNIIYLASGFLVIYMVARLFDVTSLGEFSLYFSTSGLFGGAVGVGVGLRYMPAISQTSSSTRRLRISGRAVGDTLILSHLATLLFLGSAYFQQMAPAMAATISIAIITQAAFFVSLQIYQAQRKGQMCLLLGIVRLVALLFAVVLGRIMSPEVFATIHFTLISLVVVSLVAVQPIWQEINQWLRLVTRPNWRRSRLTSLWRSMLYTSNAFIPVWIQSLVPLDLARSADGLQALAYFNVGRQWQSAIQLFGSTQSSYYMPRMMRLGVADMRVVRANALTSRLYAAAVIAISFVAAPMIHTLYFEDPFNDTGLILLALFIASGYVQYLNVHSNIAFAVGRVSPAIIQNLGLAIAFALAYFWLPGTIVFRLGGAVLIGGLVQFLLQVCMFRWIFPRYWPLTADLFFLLITGSLVAVGFSTLYFGTGLLL